MWPSTGNKRDVRPLCSRIDRSRFGLGIVMLSGACVPRFFGLHACTYVRTVSVVATSNGLGTSTVCFNKFCCAMLRQY